ncbi:MAG: dihydropteroate synthase [Succinivibrio sp.]
MKLKLAKNNVLDLSVTKVMGTIALSENDQRSIEDFVMQAKSFVKAGAELLEVGAKHNAGTVNESRVSSVIGAIIDNVDVPVAINSNNCLVIDQALRAGAAMVVSTDGLRSPGVIELLKSFDVPICLHYDQTIRIDDDADVVATVSEFFFERIDALLESGIQRKRLLIDPSVVNASIGNRLKLLGRLESFSSFALPVCIALPRQIPEDDSFMRDNHILSLTAALFCSSCKSVQIIRTVDVSEVAIAIGFWQLMSSKTKPFRLSKVIVRRLRNMRDAIHDFKTRKDK